jgi:hypothetical protein
LQPLQALAATLALFGAAAGLLAISRNSRRRRASAIGHALLAALLLGCAALLWPIASGLGHYEPWRAGQPVAELHFEELTTDRYRVTLTHLPGGRMQVFDLDGRAWRLDARTLTWRGWALEVGLVPRYQLDRLSGLSGKGAGNAPPLQTFAVGDRRSDGIWHHLRNHAYWRRVVDARQVYGPNAAMADGARTQVTLTEHGILIKPLESTVRGDRAGG